MSKFLLTLLFLFSFNTFAQTSIQREPAKVDCDDNLKICRYIAQNIKGQTLINRMLPIMFPDEDLDPADGFVRKITLKEINFWFHNSDLRQRFISLIPRFDRQEYFVPSHLVQMTTEVFSVTEEALTNLQATLSFSNNTSDDPVSPQDGIQASFGIGNWMLSAAIAAQRVNKKMELVTTIKQMVPNLANINYEHITNIYINTSSVDTKVEEAGIKVKGEVSINAENRNQVVIKDYNLYYGVETLGPDGNSRVTKLSIQPPELYIEDGLSTVLVSSNTFAVSRDSRIGLPTSVNNGHRSAKLFVVTRAKAVSYEEFVAENRRLRDLRLHQTFSTDDIQDFPAGNVDLNTVIDSILPYSKFTLSGDRLLGFKFEKSLARRSNYKKHLKIKITAPGFKQVVVRSLENLMLTGLMLDELPNKLLNKHLVKLKVKMKDFKKRGLYKYKKTLYYNPETNEFIDVD